MTVLTITGENITIEEIFKAVKEKARVELSTAAVEKISRSRGVLQKLVDEGKTVYGVNTGFGKLSDTNIPADKIDELQENIVMSHACGVGKPLAAEIVRMIMIITVARFAKGHSGVVLETAQSMVEMINQDVMPIVPEKGSLGASGDLVPLAHIALVLIGKGEAWYKNEKMSGAQALAKAGLKPVKLSYKEGLALLNGTQVMSSQGIVALTGAFKFFKTANVAASMTMEALKGRMAAFDPRIHSIRPHGGQIITAKVVRNILDGSDNVNKNANVQDAYSLRCVPQVHGATWDALNYVKGVLTTELNSVTDNPLVFPEEGDVLSGGNFHGQPIALALDFLAIALSEIANISERRLERLVNPQLSGMAPFLVKNPGVNSGLMIAQYTAASLVSENKVYSHPASVDSIPSSANQEDHVSMGSISARKLTVILENVKNVLAIELLCAVQAVDLSDGRAGLSPVTARVYETIRKEVPTLENDRIIYTDIEKIAEMLETEILIKDTHKFYE